MNTPATELLIIAIAITLGTLAGFLFCALFSQRRARRAHKAGFRLGRDLKIAQLKEELARSFPSHPSEKPPAFPESLRKDLCHVPTTDPRQP